MNPEEGGGIDWESKVDRLLVMKMIIKMADINTPSKSYELHRSWTKRITEEFYQQVWLVGFHSQAIPSYGENLLVEVWEFPGDNAMGLVHCTKSA